LFYEILSNKGLMSRTDFLQKHFKKNVPTPNLWMLAYIF